MITRNAVKALLSPTRFKKCRQSLLVLVILLNISKQSWYMVTTGYSILCSMSNQHNFFYLFLSFFFPSFFLISKFWHQFFILSDYWCNIKELIAWALLVQIFCFCAVLHGSPFKVISSAGWWYFPPPFINENYMMVLGSSKTYSFLGTKMKYNKMQMLSDTEHRWKCFITTTYGAEESTGDTVPRALVESPKAITAISVIWQKKVGGGVFIIFFMGPRWTSWQPCLWLRIHFKIVNHNKWKLRCVTVLDFSMFQVLLSLHL